MPTSYNADKAVYLNIFTLKICHGIVLLHYNSCTYNYLQSMENHNNYNHKVGIQHLSLLISGLINLNCTLHTNVD